MIFIVDKVTKIVVRVFCILLIVLFCVLCLYGCYPKERKVSVTQSFFEDYSTYRTDRFKNSPSAVKTNQFYDDERLFIRLNSYGLYENYIYCVYELIFKKPLTNTDFFYLSSKLTTKDDQYIFVMDPAMDEEVIENLAFVVTTLYVTEYYDIGLANDYIVTINLPVLEEQKGTAEKSEYVFNLDVSAIPRPSNS